MKPMERQRVVEAVNQLIDAPNYAGLLNEMTRIIETWDMHPMVYGGSLRPLNALIDVGLQNRDAFEKLVKLIEERRRMLPKVKRVDYQRELMRERRARQSKALELYELQHGTLRGAARIQYIEGLNDRWRRARAQFIKAKGDLDWRGRNEAANEFWATVDRQLDENLRDARKHRVRATA